MHILDLEAMRFILPLLYFFCPSTLHEVSTPIQELALSPYVVNEAQRGLIYAYNYLYPVPQILRALFHSGDLLPCLPAPTAASVVLDLDLPKSNHGHQHTRSPTDMTPPTRPIPSACIVQPTCSRLDAPDLANISRISLDLNIIPLARRWPTTATLKSNTITLVIALFAMLQLRSFALLVLYIYNGYNLPYIFTLFKLSLGGALYVILIKSRLPTEFDPCGLIAAVSAVFVEKDKVAIILRFTRVQHAESTRTSVPSLNLVPTNAATAPRSMTQTSQAIQSSISKADVGIPTDLALTDDRIQADIAIPSTRMPNSQVNINITQTELPVYTAKPSTSTQLDRTTVDMGVQTNPAHTPTVQVALTINRQVQTEPGSTPTSEPLLHTLPSVNCNVESDMQLGNLSRSLLASPALGAGDVTTDATFVCLEASIHTANPVDHDGPAKTSVVDRPRTELPVGSTATHACGSVPSTGSSQGYRGGTDILALGTGGSSAISVASPIPVVDRTNDSDCSFGKMALVDDDRRTDTANVAATCARPPVGPQPLTNAKSACTTGPLLCTLAPGLDVQLEDCTGAAVPADPTIRAVKEIEGKKRMDPTPTPTASIPTTATTTRNPTPTPKSTLPPRPQAPIAQTLSGTRFAQPPPFRPPGLGYQPPAPVSRTISGSTPRALAHEAGNVPVRPVTLDRTPVHSRFPGPTGSPFVHGQPQQFLAPPPISPACDRSRSPVPNVPPNMLPGNHFSRFPASPLPPHVQAGPNYMPNPHPYPLAPPQHAPTAALPRPAPRPFTLPARDLSTQDPFSRNLTPVPGPVPGPINSPRPGLAPAEQSALSFVPRHVVPVAGPPVQTMASSRALPGRFRLLPIPDPTSSSCPPASAHPTPPAPSAHPLSEKAPPFWAPPRKNSALPVVPPTKQLRVRHRMRSRALVRMDYSDAASTCAGSEDDDEVGEDCEHVGVTIASAVLGSLDDIASATSS